MIEILGAGVSGPDGAWRLRSVCSCFERGELTAVVSAVPDERLALLDVVAGRCVPHEGRVWIDGLPLMRETRRRVRARVGDADPRAPASAAASVLSNTVAGRGGTLTRLRGLFHSLSASRRRRAWHALHATGLAARARARLAQLDRPERARLVLARALAVGPQHLVVREIGSGLHDDDAVPLWILARSLAVSLRMAVIVSTSSPGLARRQADHAVRLLDGQVVFDGPATELEELDMHRSRRRLGVA